ncbi:GNAT family N-acetyltransferase [Thalassovita taeanensis]|uniref:Protein N-acetyltransferase, RimJ/RimL family n=1 Tax=Thalassovita taeanensis TaxID=657014 RepID=A0A1H9BDK7_9RHOB|nr:GNAT family protein [Thalassovita taeanensis]SEP86713.1 Protein N-acetyltransferase, RimJ/RimL family [Thalassovita taeanensis]
MPGSRPLGPLLPDWREPPRPDGQVLEGRYARLEKLDAERHAGVLFGAFERRDEVWDYLPYGPFSSASQYHRWVREVAGGDDPLFYAIRDLDTGQYGGVASFLRIAPQMGTIELGHINLSPQMQGSRAATEAFWLMMRWAFDAGYRRFEWKCHALNMPSRRAAQRLGLSYEGVFRQHMIVKGRNRDSAWFAATDTDWPALSEAFSVWLSPANFDADGRQRERLTDLTQLVRVSSDPALGG